MWWTGVRERLDEFVRRLIPLEHSVEHIERRIIAIDARLERDSLSTEEEIRALRRTLDELLIGRHQDSAPGMASLLREATAPEDEAELAERKRLQEEAAQFLSAWEQVDG